MRRASGNRLDFNGTQAPQYHQCNPLHQHIKPHGADCWGRIVLHRVIYASEAVGATGVSTLSIAQILGVSEANNRRDGIQAALMFHRGHIVQAMEGRRVDLDRLMRRLLADRRHTGLRVLVDTPITTPLLTEPITVCPDPAALLERIGVAEVSRITANEAEAILDYKYAA